MKEIIGILAIFCALLILFGLLYAILSSTPHINERELDECTREQMRDSGWTEEEIKEFMETHSYY